MKVAITGGSGFIGQYLVKQLHEQHDIIIVGRKRTSNFKVENKVFNYYHTDFSINDLKEILVNVDAVVHLSAKKVSLKSDFQSYIQDNILITNNLFDACHRLGITNIINLSSRLVYDIYASTPWGESSYENPSTFYGLSKLTTDKLVTLYNNKLQMNIKSLRVAQVVGLIGNTITEAETNFVVMKYIKLALEKKPLVIYGSGEGRRDYIYIKDLVKAIELSLEAPNKKGIYNIGSGTSTSYIDLAQKINKVFQNGDNITYENEKSEDLSEYLLDIRKAERDLKYAPCYSLEDALLEMAQQLEQE